MQLLLDLGVYGLGLLGLRALRGMLGLLELGALVGGWWRWRWQ